MPPLLTGRTARNFLWQNLPSNGNACSLTDHCADIRIPAFLYIIIKQNQNGFNAFIEQKNDVFYQKKGA